MLLFAAYTAPENSSLLLLISKNADPFAATSGNTARFSPVESALLLTFGADAVLDTGMGSDTDKIARWLLAGGCGSWAPEKRVFIRDHGPIIR